MKAACVALRVIRAAMHVVISPCRISGLKDKSPLVAQPAQQAACLVSPSAAIAISGLDAQILHAMIYLMHLSLQIPYNPSIAQARNFLNGVFRLHWQSNWQQSRADFESN